MKILLLGNYAPDAQQSMQRFASLLHKGLLKLGLDVRMICPPAVIGREQGVRNNKWLGYVDKLVLFPPILKNAVGAADIVQICDQGNSFYVPYLGEKRHLVTCHDLLAIRSALGEIESNRTGFSGRQLQKLILNGLSQARHIACVSDATKQDVRRILKLDESRASIIYNGLNYDYSPMEAVEADRRLARIGLARGDRFILHVGGNQWYKNRTGVLRIFNRVRRDSRTQALKLVMAGQPWSAEMRELARQTQLESSALELCHPCEEDLRALYTRAEVLLFPSLAEGFGWPIVEAQACGCPVVTSNRAPMTEVGGDAAVYVDPGDVNSAAAAIGVLMTNREDAREKGFRNAARFTPDEMVKAYAALYDKLLA